MKKRLVHAAFAAACVVGVVGVSCKSNPAGKIPADTTIVRYKSPDIAELTGIEPETPADEYVEPIEAPPPPPPAAAAPVKAAPIAPTPKPATPPKAVVPTSKGK